MRWAESIIREPSKGVLFANSVKIFVENTEPAPPDKAIAQRFVRAVLIRCILPLTSVLDDVDDAVDDTPVIHTGAPWERGKNGLIRSN